MRSLPGTTEVRGPWNHNLEYRRWLLGQVPVHCDHALDVGCGDGWLARRLAERVMWVTGIDLSAPMIERARQAAAGLPNVTFEVGNLLDHPLPEGRFDFISAVAVLHHLPFEPALIRLAALLRPGGILAVIGLAKDASIADLVVSAAAVPINRVLRARRGWWESGAPLADPAMSYGEIRRVVRTVLLGATVRRRLLFRYSLSWRKH
jgi:2-polyprenyl-3-methyl-5-hydroxy-6-metoxy-1,4-benzoquinol methylase